MPDTIPLGGTAWPTASGVRLTQILVRPVALRLDLERHVVDREVRGHACAELVEERADASFLQAGVADGHVRGQHGHSASDRPRMQVMYVDHARHLTQVRADVVEVKVRRRRLQQYADRV